MKQLITSVRSMETNEYNPGDTANAFSFISGISFGSWSKACKYESKLSTQSQSVAGI